VAELADVALPAPLASSGFVSLDPAAASHTGRNADALARENDILQAKLVQVSRALRGLAVDLAASRRDGRRLREELDTLRANLAAIDRPDEGRC
jgi:hypothetical protein